MTIHFVCSGNTYRGRLAEAYLLSKKLKNVNVISSGINASWNLGRPISWFAQRIMEMHGLVPFERLKWTQTTKEVLDSADLTIFFDGAYHDYCETLFGFHPTKFEIWDIKDVDPTSDEARKMRETEEAYVLIRQRVNDLIVRCNFV